VVDVSSEVEGLDDDATSRWLAEVRVEEAARTRLAVAEIQARRAEESTLAGALVELAERGEVIGLTMRSGRQHRGHVRLVGPDALVMALETRQWLVARLGAVASLRSVQAPPVPGEAEPSTSSRFVRLAAALVEPGDWVLVASGTATLGGSLVSVGTDVISLRLDNGDQAYVALDSADEVSMRPSG
jgi:hypothetical protein